MKVIFLLMLVTTINVYSQNKSETGSSVSDFKIDSCSDIEIETDRYTGEIRYRSPSIEDNISFIKTKEKGITSQYVSISLYDSYLSGYNNYGLVILFQSGKKITRSKEKIDVDYSTEQNWRYSAFFTPTVNEVMLLKTEIIIGFKLFIFDRGVAEGDMIKNYAKCILVSPKPIPKLKK
jgi:hypothetical protein